MYPSGDLIHFWLVYEGIQRLQTIASNDQIFIRFNNTSQKDSPRIG